MPMPSLRAIVALLSLTLIVCPWAAEPVIAAAKKTNTSKDPAKDKAVVKAVQAWENAKGLTEKTKQAVAKAQADVTQALQDLRQFKGSKNTSPSLVDAKQELRAAKAAIDELDKKVARTLFKNEDYQAVRGELRKVEDELKRQRTLPKIDGDLMAELTAKQIELEKALDDFHDTALSKVEGGPAAKKRLGEAEEKVQRELRKAASASDRGAEADAKRRLIAANDKLSKAKKDYYSARSRENQLRQDGESKYMAAKQRIDREKAAAARKKASNRKNKNKNKKKRKK